jgi:hypothetical protein
VSKLEFEEAQEQELSKNPSWKFIAPLQAEIFTFEDKPMKIRFSLAICPIAHYSPGDRMCVTCGKQTKHLENCVILEACLHM